MNEVRRTLFSARRLMYAFEHVLISGWLVTVVLSLVVQGLWEIVWVSLGFMLGLTFATVSWTRRHVLVTKSARA